MKNFNKVVRIGRGPNGNVFCKIAFNNGELSITGVEGPKHNGDCVGSCGQIDMRPWGITQYAPGWSAELEVKFRAVWGEWHLNDMKAGSPAQTAYLKANPINNSRDHFAAACAALEAAGLQPDPNFMHNGKPYRYGSAWLSVEVPADVVEFLEALPDTDSQPAWV